MQAQKPHHRDAEFGVQIERHGEAQTRNGTCRAIERLFIVCMLHTPIAPDVLAMRRASRRAKISALVYRVRSLVSGIQTTNSVCYKSQVLRPLSASCTHDWIRTTIDKTGSCNTSWLVTLTSFRSGHLSLQQ